MPLSVNTASVQILHDSAQRVVAKFQFFQHTANAASHEASVVKINADALMGRTQYLTKASAAPYLNLLPGEKLTANGGSGAVGYFISSDYPGDSNIHVVLAGTTPFANDDSIYSESSRFTYLVGAAGAEARDAAKLELRSLSWSIAGNTSTRVALEWAGTPNVEIVQMGTGQGYLGRNDLGLSIPNNAATPTGHVNISTYSTPAYGGYTIIAEFAKGAGFERIPNGA